MSLSLFKTGDFPWIVKDFVLNPCLSGLKLVVREQVCNLLKRLAVMAGDYQHMLLVLIFVCKPRAGPGLTSDLCSPATGRGELRCHPMGPLPSGWLHDPSRGWEYSHMLTAAALGFLKPCPSLRFFPFLLISRGNNPRLCKSLSHLLPRPRSASLLQFMPVIRRQHRAQLGKPFIPPLPLPAHSSWSLLKLPAPHPIGPRMNLQLAVLPDMQARLILWLPGTPGDPTPLPENISS